MDLATYNAESWKDITSFYEDLLTKPSQAALQPVLELVRLIAASERAQRFQAGVSVHRLIVSTVDYYGFKDGDRYVIVEPLVEPGERKIKGFQITYRIDRQTFVSMNCDANALLSTLEPMLDQLWADTRGRDINPIRTNDK